MNAYLIGLLFDEDSPDEFKAGSEGNNWLENSF